MRCTSRQTSSPLGVGTDSTVTTEPKEANEHTVHLLLHLKVEAQVNVLEPCQQDLILVHK